MASKKDDGFWSVPIMGWQYWMEYQNSLFGFIFERGGLRITAWPRVFGHGHTYKIDIILDNMDFCVAYAAETEIDAAVRTSLKACRRAHGALYEAF